MLSPAVALLADGRFPTGGHAHSGGFESAHRAFGLRSVDDVREVVDARLRTTGKAEAALLAAIRHRIDTSMVNWQVVDDELTARIAPPALRKVSRSLGRQWLRAGTEVFGADSLAHVDVCEEGPHQLAAVAAVMAAAGVPAPEVLVVHLHHLVATVTTAAVRLLGADPWAMQRLQHELGPDLSELSARAFEGRDRPWRHLPAWSAPRADQLGQEHASWDVRLFRS